MDWETIKTYLEQYGYPAIILGTMADQSGMQMFIVGGGTLAKVSDKFLIWIVFAAGALGNFAADAVFFGLGRWRADWLEHFVKKPKAKARMKVLRRWMHKWALPLIGLGRFFPWIGRFVPAAAGLQKVPVWKVALYSLCGSVLAGVAFGALGYGLGESIVQLDEYSIYIVIGVVVGSIPASWWLLRRFDRVVKEELKDETEQNPAPGGELPASVVKQGAD